MTQPIRVLQVIGNSKYGGDTNVVCSLVEMAREHGFEAEILSDEPGVVEAAMARGIELFRFRGIDRPVRPHKDLWAAIRLARALRGRYDLVHTHTSKGGAIGRLATHWAKIPVVLHTVHGFAFHEFSSRLVTRVGAAAERRLAKWCDKIIVVNTFDRLRALDLGIGRHDQLITIYNGVEEARLEAGRNVDRQELLAELGISGNAFLCVNVGRLSAQKGLPYLFEAMAIVKQKLTEPAVHVAMVGEGELEADCRQQVQQLGVSDRVHFLGFRRDCMRWTGGGDMFVLSSLWEGHSMTLLEAMGLGRPIVATDIKGNRESITPDKDGTLAAPADANALAEGIMAMVTDPDRARSQAEAARRTFEERFTECRMKEDTWKVYQELLTQKGLL